MTLQHNGPPMKVPFCTCPQGLFHGAVNARSNRLEDSLVVGIRRFRVSWEESSNHQELTAPTRGKLTLPQSKRAKFGSKFR